jgi:hypothetical protein
MNYKDNRVNVTRLFPGGQVLFLLEIRERDALFATGAVRSA